MLDEKQQTQLRVLLNASENKRIAAAAHDLMIKMAAANPPWITYATSHYHIRADEMRALALLMARGIQWEHERHSDVPGPEAVLMGPYGSQIEYKGIKFPVTNVSHGWHPDTATSVIIIPFEFMVLLADKRRKGETVEFDQESRRSLGKLTVEEAAFVHMVEEVRHSVQRQRPEEARKYAVGETLNSCSVGMGVPKTTEHSSAMEIDVVPEMQLALQYFRTLGPNFSPPRGYLP